MDGTTFLHTGTQPYQLQCSDASAPPFSTCHDQCIVNPSTACQILTNSVVSLPLLSNKSHSNRHRFLVNLPFLHHFFNPEELRQLGGGEFLEAPPKFHLPTLKLFLNPVKELIAENKKMEIDMGQVVDSLKKDSTLIHSLSDGIVYTNQSQTQLFGDTIEYIVLFLIICLSLAILQLTYCTIKLRTLSLLLAVLQQNLVPQADAQTYLANPYQLSFTLNPSPAKEANNLHIFFTSTMNSYWSYVLVLVVVLGIGYVGIKYLKNRFCKIYPTVTSELVFQFTSLTTTVVIPIISFANSAKDLKLSYRNTLKNFEIHGLYPINLTFRWNAVMIDTVSLVETAIPGCVSISPLMMWKLKRIFQNRFVIQVFVKSNQDYSKVTLDSQVESGMTTFSSMGTLPTVSMQSGINTIELV